jgi:hypothetical protein
MQVRCSQASGCGTGTWVENSKPRVKRIPLSFCSLRLEKCEAFCRVVSEFGTTDGVYPCNISTLCPKIDVFRAAARRERNQRTGWRRGWDSNPRLSFPNTRFPSVLLKPLGHLSVIIAIRLAYSECGPGCFCELPAGNPDRRFSTAARTIRRP